MSSTRSTRTSASPKKSSRKANMNYSESVAMGKAQGQGQHVREVVASVEEIVAPQVLAPESPSNDSEATELDNEDSGKYVFFGKTKTVANKVKDIALGINYFGSQRLIKPIVDVVDGQATKRWAQFEVDDKFSTLDNKVNSCIDYGSEKKDNVKAKITYVCEGPKRMKDGTIMLVHNRLAQDDKKPSPEDVGVGLVVNDVTDILYQQYDKACETRVVKSISGVVTPKVQSISNVVTPRVEYVTGTIGAQSDKIINVGERIVNYVLPAEDEEENVAVAEAALTQSRLQRVNFIATQVGAKRIKRRLVNNIKNVDLKVREGAVYTVDLFHYSKLIDIENMKGRVQVVKDTVDTRVFEPVRGVGRSVIGAKDNVVGRVVGVKDTVVGRVVDVKDNVVGVVSGVKDNVVGKVVGVKDTVVKSVVGVKDNVVGKANDVKSATNMYYVAGKNKVVNTVVNTATATKDTTVKVGVYVLPARVVNMVTDSKDYFQSQVEKQEKLQHMDKNSYTTFGSLRIISLVTFAGVAQAYDSRVAPVISPVTTRVGPYVAPVVKPVVSRVSPLFMPVINYVAPTVTSWTGINLPGLVSGIVN